MAVPDRLKLGVSFSPQLMQAELLRIEKSDWISHFVHQNYDGDWSILPLRGPKGEEHPIRMAYSDPNCDSFEDTIFLDNCPYFREVLSAFPFELHAVRLMSLSAGSRIKEHRDYDLSLEDGTIRLHIPIRTNKNVEFFLNQERVNMTEGECWYLRLSDLHSVYNGGAEDRVHLVIDAPVAEGVLDFLLEGTNKV